MATYRVLCYMNEVLHGRVNSDRRRVVIVSEVRLHAMDQNLCESQMLTVIIV